VCPFSTHCGHWPWTTQLGALDAVGMRSDSRTAKRTNYLTLAGRARLAHLLKPGGGKWPRSFRVTRAKTTRGQRRPPKVNESGSCFRVALSLQVIPHFPFIPCTFLVQASDKHEFRSAKFALFRGGIVTMRLRALAHRNKFPAKQGNGASCGAARACALASLR